MSADMRAFLSSTLSGVTPALRVAIASRLMKKSMPLEAIPTTWIASAANPSTSDLWLGARGADLLTGPGIQPGLRVTGGSPAEKGVWVQFNAEAGLPYMLICDLTGPERWDMITDARSRAPLSRESETRGFALVPGKASSGYRRIMLTLTRPLEISPGVFVPDVLRRCEVTGIRR